MESFLLVMSKVGVLFIMIGVGFVLAKKKILTDTGIREITTVLLYVVLPCLIINSFISDDSGISGGNLLLAGALALASHVIGIVVSLFVFRRQPQDRRKLLQFATVFSNAGFMGLPLVQSVVGSAGVIYASIFIVAFNIACWTYGYAMMNSGAKISLRSAFLNPGVIGFIIGLPLFLLKVQLPELLTSPLQFFSNLNTPLAMVVVGTYIARISFKDAVSDKSVYQACLLRLVVCPLLFLLLMTLIHPEKNMYMSFIIQSSAPVAANAVLFAVQARRDARLGSIVVAVSTLLSILTIPLFTLLAQILYAL